MTLGIKRIETRSWSTDHRGTLAIHSSRTFRPDAKEFARSHTVRELLRLFKVAEDDPLLAWPLGFVLCTVELDAIVPTERFTDLSMEVGLIESVLGDFSPGRFAWSTSGLWRLPNPAYAVGQRGVWTWENSGALLRR